MSYFCRVVIPPQLFHKSHRAHPPEDLVQNLLVAKTLGDHDSGGEGELNPRAHPQRIVPVLPLQEFGPHDHGLAGEEEDAVRGHQLGLFVLGHPTALDGVEAVRVVGFLWGQEKKMDGSIVRSLVPCLCLS